MKNKILIILGHPNNNSLCSDLAQSYIKEAEKKAEVRYISLSNLKFDPILHKGYKEKQELEPDLVKAQEDILWANHIVWVFPVWWGGMPALMNGFIDRTILPGFGFKYGGKKIPKKLLKGRSARLIMTMGGPVLYNKFVYCNAVSKILVRATLKFCGINPVRVTQFGSASNVPEKEAKKWIEKVKKLGNGLL